MIYQTRELEERFLKVGLGYKVLGGIRFYERSEIKDIISILELKSKFDDLALERVSVQKVLELTLNLF